jgi:DNA invertase Pin-like site-specific DNA recombinase
MRGVFALDEKTLWVQTLWNPLNEMSNSPLESKDPGIRVAAYCRISNNRNNFVSLINQVSYYTGYIRSKDNWKFVGIYYDNGISGAIIDNRPSFKRMIRHCKEGKIDLILTKSISRFSRNIKELIDIIEELKKVEVAVYFEKENIDTSTEYNRLLLEVYTSIYQEEIENYSQLTRIGYEKKFSKGIPTYGQLYGYDVDKNKGNPIITINDEEAKVIRWIFDMFINGTTYAEIARKLVKSGAKTKKGKYTWTKEYVKKILTSLIYTGNKIAITRTKDLFTNEITEGQRDQFLFENSHPAIISKEIFDKAQLRVSKKSLKHKTYTKKPFSGRIICGYCKEMYNSKPPGYKIEYMDPMN